MEEGLEAGFDFPAAASGDRDAGAVVQQEGAAAQLGDVQQIHQISGVGADKPAVLQQLGGRFAKGNPAHGGDQGLGGGGVYQHAVVAVFHKQDALPGQHLGARRGFKGEGVLLGQKLPGEMP